MKASSRKTKNYAFISLAFSPIAPFKIYYVNTADHDVAFAGCENIVT